MIGKSYYQDEIARKATVETVEKLIGGKLAAIDAKLAAAENILDHKMTAFNDEVTVPKKEIAVVKDVAKSTESRFMTKLNEIGGEGPPSAHIRWLVSLCLGVSLLASRG